VGYLQITADCWKKGGGIRAMEKDRPPIHKEEHQITE